MIGVEPMIYQYGKSVLTEKPRGIIYEFTNVDFSHFLYNAHTHTVEDTVCSYILYIVEVYFMH